MSMLALTFHVTQSYECVQVRYLYRRVIVPAASLTGHESKEFPSRLRLLKQIDVTDIKVFLHCNSFQIPP